MIKHAIFSSQSSVYSWWGSIQSITDLNPDFKESLDIEIMKSKENKEQRYICFLSTGCGDLPPIKERPHVPLSHLQSRVSLIDFKHYEAPELQIYTKINTCATCTQNVDFTLPKCGCTPSSAAAGEQEGVILQEPVLHDTGGVERSDVDSPHNEALK
jgi:hypothetical protein